MNSYISLDELKRVLGDDELETGKADNILRRFCIRASRVFDNRCTNKVYPRRTFYPTYETRYFDHPVSVGGSVLVPSSTGQANELRFCDDLLQLDTLTTENGATTISSADSLLYTWPGRYQPTPYDTVRLQPNGTVTQFSYNNTPFKANALTGWWGYHEDWDSAWEDSGDTVQDVGGVDATVTSLTVADANGDDINGIKNRFQNLQLLRIDTEYVWVSKVDPSSNILTIVRGVNGTTAAIHALDAKIEIYRPMGEVKMALEFLATHLYKRKDSIGTPDQRPLAAAKGLLVFPPSMPKEVQDIVNSFKKDAL